MIQHRTLLFVLYVALCGVFTWILLVGDGWWLAVPGAVTLGLVAVGLWMKRTHRGLFRPRPDSPSDSS